MAQFVRAPAHIAGDPGSNPGSGENFSLKLLIVIKSFTFQLLTYHNFSGGHFV